MNYIDAIVYFCEINELEVDSISKLISKSLKERPSGTLFVSIL